MPAEARRLDLVSDRVGLVRSLTAVTRGADEPRPPYVMQAVLSHFDFKAAPLRDRIAAGKGETEEEARASALGEAVEHYCAAHADLAAARRATFAEFAAGDAVAPPDCVLYAESQYRRPGWPYARFDPTVPILWTRMQGLAGAAGAWAASSLVHLGWSGAPQESFCPSTSNGLAAGEDLTAAILAGLCELIERDAFLISWMNRLPAPEVDLTGAGGVEESIPRHYARHGIEVRVFALPSDIAVPAMMAVACDRSGRGPAALVGLGCHPRPRTALRKALFELCQVRPGEVQRFQSQAPHQRLRGYEDVHGIEDHSAFLSVPERRGELDFLLDDRRGVRRVSLGDLPGAGDDDAATRQQAGAGDAAAATRQQDLDRVGAALSGAGCRALYAELTTPDVAAYGYRVVRTLATGLQPIHFGHGQERLGGRRLFEVPACLGYRDSPAAESDLNPCPHPLA